MQLPSKNSAGRRRILQVLLILLCGLLFGLLPTRVGGQSKRADLADASLESLMNMQVTSASKSPARFAQVAAAMYVITQEDIRRSGGTSIAELLRMVPGLDVAQINGSTWAISSRGFNDRFANKLLVLIDGRTVYTPLFTGVLWDAQDTLLEDIERIEVIRGPGASLWGANAVNGVINIITKHPRDTQGGLVTAGAGDQERGFGAVRYGAKTGDSGFYRFFAKSFRRGASADALGQDAGDDWYMLRGGFRSDWTLTPRDSLTVQGDIFNGNSGQVVPEIRSLAPVVVGNFPGRNIISGGDVLARWSRTISPRSETSLQVYYDRSDRDLIVLKELRDTVDVDFQHHLAVGARHDIIWGLGYRFTTDQTQGSLTVSFNPASRGDNLNSAFLQDEISLVPDRLRLTVGIKVEHNDYNGSSVQPDFRLLWTPHPAHALWGAVSRAIGTPGRANSDTRYNASVFPGPGGVPIMVSLLGNPQEEAEEVWAYQVGYRAQLSRRLTLDFAGFYNSYDEIRGQQPGAPFLETSPSPVHIVLPLYGVNALKGNTRGVEIAPTWNVTHRWRLVGSYSWFQSALVAYAPTLDSSLASANGNSPHHQWNLRSNVDLPGHVEFDTTVYYASRLNFYQVPGHTRLDARIAWHPMESSELSLVGQNLLDARHYEFGGASQVVEATQVKRSIFAKFTWRFY